MLVATRLSRKLKRGAACPDLADTEAGLSFDPWLSQFRFSAHELLTEGDILLIRVAEAGESEAVSSVINAAFRNAEGFLIDGDRIELAAVEELFGTGTFLVAEEGGFIVGCVHVEMRGNRSYLGLLSVDPERQKAGVGSKLMTAAEDHCAKAGSHFMDLRIVNVRKELPDFYHRRGYAETGTAPFTPGLAPKVPCHFVNMSKPLR